jgi:hypothetical protein
MRIKLGRLLISVYRGDPKAHPKVARAGWGFVIGLGIGKRTFNLGYRSNARPVKRKSAGPPAGLQPVWLQSWHWGRWYFIILTSVKD